MNAIISSVFLFVRIIVIFFALFYIPGIAFINLIFIKSNIPPVAKKFLSMASGILISSLIAWVLLLIIGQINMLSFFCILSVQTSLCWIGSLCRKCKLLTPLASQPDSQRPLFNSIIGVLTMIVGILFAINPIENDLMFVDHSLKNSTEFYITPNELSAIIGPNWEANQILRIPVEVENHYLASQEFIILIVQNDKVLLVIDDVKVGGGNHIKRDIEVPTEMISSDQPLDIFLYDPNLTSNHPHLRLWLWN